jgi:hypothetical protein
MQIGPCSNKSRLQKTGERPAGSLQAAILLIGGRQAAAAAWRMSEPMILGS